jgi:hypothetical protein
MKTMKTITAAVLLLLTTGSFAHTFNTSLSAAENGNDNPIVRKEEPFFRKSGDKLYLNFFNREMGDVQIRVIDSENRIVYSETLKSTLLVEKAFNFEKAEKDSYKVILRDGDETYAEYYVVK